MRSIERRDKAVGHHREMSLTLRADMRNLEPVAQSFDSESARGKLDAFLPPDQWSLKTFMQFLSREIASVKTGRSTSDQDPFDVAMESILYETN